MPSSDVSPAAITSLGRYEIVGRIATGGMATVYLARLAADGGFSREFALKVIHPHLAEDEDFRGRFLQEARLAARVRHPNAVATIDAGQDRGYAYMALELIDGLTLRQLMLHRQRPFSATEAADIVAQVARGLSALHTATDDDDNPLGIIHRDLSPHNVMLDRSGRAILIDLGLAKARDHQDLTQVGVLCGKLPYMSPEQARLDPLDARSDVFALGTVLFELVTGELPFGESHTLATLEKIQTCDAAALERALVEASVPGWLREIIIACLRANPDDRFSSAEDLAVALTQGIVRLGGDASAIRRRLSDIVGGAMPELAQITASAPLPQLLEPPPQPQRGAPAWRWAAVGAMVVIAGSIGFHFLSTWGAQRPTERRLREAASLAADSADEHNRAGRTIATVPASLSAPKQRSQSQPEPTEQATAGEESGSTGDDPTSLDQPGALEYGPLPPIVNKRRSRRAATSDRSRRELKPNPYSYP